MDLAFTKSFSWLVSRVVGLFTLFSEKLWESIFQSFCGSSEKLRQTRTLLVALSLACLEMSFVVKGPGAVILLFRFEYKTSVVCHNVYTQKLKKMH